MSAKIRLQRGFSLIGKSDVRYKITSGNHSMDKITLQDFYNDSKLSDTWVVLRRQKNVPVGVIELTIHMEKVEGVPEYANMFMYVLVVELLAVDVSTQGKGIGTDLMAVAENVGQTLNAYEISLEAVEDKINFYEALGYKKIGSRYLDPEWGYLTHMRKKIEWFP